MTDRHPEDIKAALRKRGFTLTVLAEANGLHKQVLSLALTTRHARAEAAIAEALGEAPQAIWPSRYRLDGTRIQLRRGRPTDRKAAA